MPELDAPAGADVAGFHAIDQEADPQALIRFLYRANAQPELRALEMRMLRELRLGPGSRVLDVGCGYGADAAEILRQLEAGSVVGVDVSRTMIEEARRRNGGPGGGLSYQVADVARLPFGDDTCDGCRAEAVFEHGRRPAGPGCVTSQQPSSPEGGQ